MSRNALGGGINDAPGGVTPGTAAAGESGAELFSGPEGGTELSGVRAGSGVLLSRTGGLGRDDRGGPMSLPVCGHTVSATGWGIWQCGQRRNTWLMGGRGSA